MVSRANQDTQKPKKFIRKLLKLEKLMKNLDLSSKGNELIKLYQKMANEGYMRNDGVKVEVAYSDFELKKFRHICRDHFFQHNIKTVLDYGAGGSDWENDSFEPIEKKSAKQFFNLDQVTCFEPARNLFNKKKADCVVCMDVLEHIFITDVPKIVEELFSLAGKLLIVNVACYKAAALLPNGENAHVTVRSPDWWKGVFDTVSMRHKNTEVVLICSTSFTSGFIFDNSKADDWDTSECFSTEVGVKKFQPN